MKAMVGLVLALLIIFGYRLFWPSSEPELNTVSDSDVSIEKTEDIESYAENESISSSQQLNAPSDKEKTRLMRAEYERLEEARTKLKRHIARLKHEMWGLRFPADIAKKISMTVLGANKLLKNPHMLGAFYSVEQIKDEIAKVEFAENSLIEIDEIVKAAIEEKQESTN